MKTFEQWDIDDVERTFGLKRVKHSKTLEDWLVASHPINEQEQNTLNILREELSNAVNDWNEDELKFHFIAPLLGMVRYTTEYVRPFTQRKLTATVHDIQLTGRVDFVVATGKSKPIEPFFFVHEYKKEHSGDGDPRAQLLVEMLAARALNTNEHPLYGCYVVGRMWFFLILEGNEYAESTAYIASNTDLERIFSILREAKHIIVRFTEPPHIL
jgi:hypothetical protein